jgi:hypothetical protein
MSYPFAITCLECRQSVPLVSIEPVETSGAEPWIRLVMECGHAPSVPERHRTAIERIAIGTSGGYGLYDPDGRPTYIVRGRPT